MRCNLQNEVTCLRYNIVNVDVEEQSGEAGAGSTVGQWCLGCDSTHAQFWAVFLLSVCLSSFRDADSFSLTFIVL